MPMFNFAEFEKRLEAIKGSPEEGLKLFAELQETCSGWSNLVLASMFGWSTPEEMRAFTDRVDDMQSLEDAWDLVSRVRETGAYENREAEDGEYGAPLTPPSLETGFRALEDRGLRVVVVVFNPRDYADVQMFGRDVLDLETRVVFLRAGLMSVLWGALVLVDKNQPETEVMFLGEVLGEERQLQVSASAIQVIKVDR